jgi:hypothetical protein
MSDPESGQSKSNPGRPQWRPTNAERNQVRILTGYGIPRAEIATIFGISENTLRRHCQPEMDSGAALANAKAAEFLFHQFAPPPGREIADLRVAVISAMFWLKCRAGWRETVNIATEPGKPIEVRTVHARRLIDELDQMASRLGPLPGGEDRPRVEGPSGDPPGTPEKTVH